MKRLIISIFMMLIFTTMGLAERGFVCVSASGDVGAAGTVNDPVNSLNEAVKLLADQGRAMTEIRIHGNLTGESANLDLQEYDDVLITGGWNMGFTDRNETNNSVLNGNREIGQVFMISNCQSIEIDGITITGGASPKNGGGIGFYHSDLCSVNESVIITNNEAEYYGGGIYMNYSSQNIIMAKIMNNEGYGGGGLFIHGDENIINGTVSDNKAVLGGGIYLFQASLNTIGGDLSKIGANVAYDNGGGLYVHYSDHNDFEGIITHNDAWDHGGGIYYAKGAQDNNNYAEMTGNTPNDVKFELEDENK